MWIDLTRACRKGRELNASTLYGSNAPRATCAYIYNILNQCKTNLVASLTLGRNGDARAMAGAAKFSAVIPRPAGRSETSWMRTSLPEGLNRYKPLLRDKGTSMPLISMCLM